MKSNRHMWWVAVAVVCVLGSAAPLAAQSVTVTGTDIKEDSDAVQIMVSTNKSIQIECYDLSNPPQVIVDFMGEIYTNSPEIVTVDKGPIKQLRMVKGTRKATDLNDSYYSLDFIIIDMTEALRYDFAQGLTNGVVVISKPGKLVKAVAETPVAAVAAAPVPAVAAPAAAVTAVAPAKKQFEQEQDMPAAKPAVTSASAAAPAAATVSPAPVKAPAPEKAKIAEEPKPAPAKSRRRTLFEKKKEPAAAPQAAAQAEKVEKAGKVETVEKAEKPKRTSRRAAKKAEPKPEKPAEKSAAKPVAYSSDPERRVAQVKERKQQQDALIEQILLELSTSNAAREKARGDLDSLDTTMQKAAKEKTATEQSFEASVMQANAAKAGANDAWNAYAKSKEDLSLALAGSGNAAAAQKAYDDNKAKLERTIKAAEAAKKETERTYGQLNTAKQRVADLEKNKEQPAREVDRTQAEYQKNEGMLKTAQAELVKIEADLVEAERGYQQYKLDKADEEYRKSMMAIDSELLTKMEADKRKADEDLRRAEEQKRKDAEQQQKLAADKKRQAEAEQKAKEDAERAALAKIEKEQKAAAAKEAAKAEPAASPRRRKAETLPPPAPPAAEAKPAAMQEEILTSAVEMRNAGLELQRSGDYDGAMRYYQKALMSDPKYAAVHNDLGILYEQRGLDEKAKNEYLAALKADAQYSKAHSNLALLYEKTGDLNKAYYHWKQRAQLGRPDDPWTQRAADKVKEYEQKK